MMRVLWMVLALVLAAAPATAQPVALSLPAPTGPHRIGVAELHLVDDTRPDPVAADRPRELMVSVWYPAADGGEGAAPYMPPGAARVFGESLMKPLGRDPAKLDLAGLATHAGLNARPARGRHPVVLYSPGGNIPRAFGTSLVEDLASRGYVVVTIDHPHEAAAVEFPGGRVVTRDLPPGEDRLQRMLETRVADVRFVLSVLENGARLPGGLARAIDLSKVGMFGHSAGGFAALEALSRDRRIDAAANLDGSLAFSMSRGVYGPVVERGLDRPFLLVGAGTSGRERKPHTHAYAPEWRRLWERSTGWKRDLHIAAGEHMSFSDQQVLFPQVARELGLPPLVVAASVGAIAPDRSTALQRAYLGAFFDLHLKGRAQPLFAGPSPRYPEVAFIP